MKATTKILAGMLLAFVAGEFLPGCGSASSGGGGSGSATTSATSGSSLAPIVVSPSSKPLGSDVMGSLTGTDGSTFTFTTGAHKPSSKPTDAIEDARRQTATATLTSLSAGNVIFGSTGDAGFLRKVTKVTQGANTITVNTIPATLEDLISSGEIQGVSTASTSTDISLKPSASEKPELMPGVTMTKVKAKPGERGDSIRLHLDNVSLKPSVSSSSSERKIDFSGSGVSVSGDVNIGSPTSYTHLAFDSSLGLTQLQFELKGSMSASLTVTVTGSAEAETQVAKIPLSRVPIPLPIPGTAIVILPRLNIILGAKATVSAAISRSVNYTLNYDAGITYDKDSGWGTISDYSFAPSASTNTSSTSAELELYTEARAHIAVAMSALGIANVELPGEFDYAKVRGLVKLNMTGG